MKLMIVEDHERFRGLLKELFKAEGTKFVEFADGTGAVRSFADEKPDWVLMDIQMKPMDGLTATRAIKTKHPSAKIVMLTHCTEPDMQDAAADAGASYFVCKDDLLLLRELLYGGQIPNSKI
jgi:CheY-like chemotaxis protein